VNKTFVLLPVACLIGCASSVPTSPVGALSPAPQSYFVSGVVFETVAGILRPVANRKVDLYMNGCMATRDPCTNENADVVETDQNGRYTVQVTVYPKTLMFVTGAGLHAAGQQPCLANARIVEDTTLDVKVFPIGTTLTPPAAAGPMVTGFVYETTPQGRNPMRGIWAELQVGTADYYAVARTQTDAAGRFFFCRVNAPVQLVVSSFEEMRAAGYERGVAFIPGTGDMHFEIELRR
jgi:hypothetical protein